MKKLFTLFSLLFAYATIALAQNSIVTTNKSYENARQKINPPTYIEPPASKSLTPIDCAVNDRLYSINRIEVSRAFSYCEFLIKAMENNDDIQKNLRRDVTNLLMVNDGSFIIMNYKGNHWDVILTTNIPLYTKEVHVLCLPG